MKFKILATDYDGTLAWNGTVAASTIAALKQYKEVGGKLLLVTGRELNDLFNVFADTFLFDMIVAENGALLYTPTTQHFEMLAAPPPEEFVAALRERGVRPLLPGRVVVDTQEVNAGIVREVIEQLGLDLQMILNKGALMVLPKGIDKASGLLAALERFHLSTSVVAGVGDAENDAAFLRICGCAAAVQNALPWLKEEVDLVTEGSRGDGVAEFIGRLISGELPEPDDDSAIGSSENARAH